MSHEGIQVGIREMSESEPPKKYRNANLHQNRRYAKVAGKSARETCLLLARCTVYRWHEPYSGSFEEQEKSNSDGKGKAQPCGYRGG